MKQKNFETIREYLYWQYANLAMAHVALKNNHIKYETIDYMIRAKLFKGLINGSQKISSLYDDEKCKLNSIQCCYCGSKGNLSLDHLIPRYSGGSDLGQNIVYACKSCNSSKNNKDLIVWCAEKNSFPPILTLRRYMKLAFYFLNEKQVLDLPYEQLSIHCDIFKLNLLPYNFPQPEYLRL